MTTSAKRSRQLRSHIRRALRSGRRTDGRLSEPRKEEGGGMIRSENSEVRGSPGGWQERHSVGGSPFSAGVGFVSACLPSLSAPRRTFESARTRC